MKEFLQFFGSKWCLKLKEDQQILQPSTDPIPFDCTGLKSRRKISRWSPFGHYFRDSHWRCIGATTLFFAWMRRERRSSFSLALSELNRTEHWPLSLSHWTTQPDAQEEGEQGEKGAHAHSSTAHNRAYPRKKRQHSPQATFHRVDNEDRERRRSI